MSGLGAVLAVALALTLVDATAASAAGSGVVNVTISPVDSLTGDPQTTAQYGSNNNTVSYRVNYSCAVATCDNATVTLSAPPANPWGIALSGATAPGLLRYSTWTAPSGGGTISGDDTTGKTVSLGSLAAGSSGSFLIVYAFPTNINRAVSPGSLYPDGFKLTETATITSSSVTAPVTADAAAVTWHTQLPSGPSIVVTNPGTVKPDTQVTYEVRMNDGSMGLSGGNIFGRAQYQAAGNTTVIVTLPPEATYVSSDYSGVYDPAANTVTWMQGTVAAPTQCAAGGWGSTVAPQNNWNITGPCYAPRHVTVSYPATAFPAADASGCNFDANVSVAAHVDVTYLDDDRTSKSADASVTNPVSCYSPFGRLTQAKDVSNDDSHSATRLIDVPPVTDGMTCPSSGFDDWGRACTPGQPLAAFGPSTKYWIVTGANAGNVPGVVTLTDDDLDQPGMPVNRITTTATTPTPTIAYTYQCNDDAPITATAQSTNLLLSSLVSDTTGCRFTAATVTSGQVAPGNIRPADTGNGTGFSADFYFTVQPGTATGVRTNTASASISYPDYPGLDTLNGTASRSANLIALPKSNVVPRIAASFPVAPVVDGGGQAVPGRNVTFTMAGATSSFGGTSDFAPQYVFIAPVGWTVTKNSAAFTATVPDGVKFDYRTVTISGSPRDVVVASWPDGVTFGENATLPSMTVVATPTYAVSAGTTSVASAWIGDVRNTVWTSTTATFLVPQQDTPDVDGDGSTAEWFASATQSVVVSGVAATTVVKQICQPDPAQADGCDWVGDAEHPVPVSTVASAIKYRVVITNSGNTTLSGLVAYDVLPYIGDTGTSDGTASAPRGSTFNESLVSIDQSSNGLSLDYSSSTNPPRPQVFSGTTTGDWTAAALGARAIRAQYGSSLAPGASVMFNYTAAVGSGAAADARACNSIAVRTSQTLSSEPPAVCATTVEADLSAGGPASVQAQIGRPVTLPFVFGNAGRSASAPASVTVEVPAGLTVTDLAPAGWSCTAADDAPVAGPASLTCVPSAEITDGDTVQLNLRGIATAADFSVKATITGPYYDPKMSNNDAAIAVHADPAATALIVTKSDGLASLVVGSKTTYTITVRNPLTTEALSNVTVTDALPAGLQFVSASAGGNLAGGAVSWTVPSLPASGTASMTVTVLVADSAPNTVANTANAAVADPAFDGTTLKGSATDTDAVDRIALTKTVSLPDPTDPKPGDVATYTFVATNSGGGVLSNVAITDAMSGLSAVKIDSWPTLPGYLAVGESITGHASYTVTQADIDAGTLGNTATAAGTSTEDAQVSAAATATVALIADPAIALTKTADLKTGGASPKAGDVIDYGFTVRNTGNVTAHGIAITDPMPGLSAVTFDTWPDRQGDLGAGQSVTATASYTLTQADVDAGSVVNTATTTATDPAGATLSAKDQATVMLPSSPSISLTKTGALDDPSTVGAGSGITYAFTATNDGNVTLTGVQVADLLPGLSSISYGSWPGKPGTLEPGQSVGATATYTATLADVNAGKVDNSALVTATAPGGAVVSGTAVATVTLAPNVALTLKKTATLQSAGAPKAGDIVDYSFVITNGGNVSLTGIALHDAMQGLSTVTYGAWPGAVGDLDPGQSVTATATYALTQDDLDRGSITNSAAVDGETTHGVPAEGSDAVTTPLAAAPSVTLSKHGELDTSGTPKAGDTITYTFDVTNSGNVTDDAVSIVDALPGLSAIAYGAWPAAAGVLAPGQHVTATAHYTLTQADLDTGDVDNQATASATGARGGPVTGGDSVDIELPAAPALALTKTADPAHPSSAKAGDIVTYTFTATNTGNVTENGVAISDDMIGLGQLSYGSWPSAVGALAPGESVTATAEYTLTQADLDEGSVYNEAAVTGHPVRGGAISTDDADVTIELPAAPALSFTKTGELASADRPEAGQSAEFTFTITNTGNVSVSDIAIDDQLQGVSIPAFGDWPGDKGVLAPGESVVATAEYILTQADVDSGSLSNTATATGTPARGDALSEDATATLTLPAVPGLSIIKTGKLSDTNADGVANPGETIAYSFVVTNTGNVTLHDVVVNDPMVTGVPTIGDLAPGDSQTVAASPYTVTRADAAAGSIENRATASGTTPAGVRFASHESVVKFDVRSLADPALAGTGSDLAPWIAGGAALLVLGLWLALAARRRRRRV